VPDIPRFDDSDTITWEKTTQGKLKAHAAPTNSVSDTAYGSSWNGVTDIAPSKNAVYDKIESVVAGAGIWTEISRQVLGSDTATVTFSSISGSYKQLILVGTGRDTQSAVAVDIKMRFNNDSSAIYDGNQLVASNGVVFSAAYGAATSGNVGIFPGATSTRSGSRGQFEILIPDYATTTFEKSAVSTLGCIAGTTNQIYVGTLAVNWRSASAITRIDLLASTNFKTGSIFTLYGIA